MLVQSLLILEEFYLLKIYGTIIVIEIKQFMALLIRSDYFILGHKVNIYE